MRLSERLTIPVRVQLPAWYFQTIHYPMHSQVDNYETKYNMLPSTVDDL